MARRPAFFRPQLATLVKESPDGDEWLHEIKYDGYRIGCMIRGREIRLVSRNNKDWTEKFPEIRDAALGLNLKQAVLDGEVAVELADGRTSFHALQMAGAGSRARLFYFAFDLLELGGRDLRSLPLQERKAELQRLLAKADSRRIRYAEHISGNGPGFYQEACRIGLEGIVSKRRDARYRPGRNRDWLKTKCSARQEFVIGGFTEREDEASSIGALLIGVNKAGKLVFAGKVGTGFTHKGARALRAQLNKLKQSDCPFTPRPKGWLGRGAAWVRPELVAEVSFTEWTPDGKVRHPSFQGLREDKRAQEIVAEQPAAAPAPDAKASVARPRKTSRARDESAIEIAGVRLTHPDRVLYPDLGLTKTDLARYYQTIGEAMLPHVLGRPLTLVRCPEGLSQGCHYMKHSPNWAPPDLRRVQIQEQKKIGDYLIIESLAGLISLVQMNVLEIHTWNSTFARVEQPDRIVFDLDPGPRVEAAAIVEAARLLRGILEELRLKSFVKTTGGAGLHVVIPIEPHGWAECMAFSRSLAEEIARRKPALYTTAFPKAGREKKILIDYLRNNRTQTSVAAFSPRAREGAPVSVPLAWEELKAERILEPCTVRTLPQRLARLERDPWREYWKLSQQLPRL
jgi:bifunctional non-homologous end joining protein LigD